MNRQLRHASFLALTQNPKKKETAWPTPGYKGPVHYGGGHLNFIPLKLSYYNDKFLMPSIGNYKIDEQIILASVPIGLMLRGMRLKTFQANFQGIIKNADTIIDWHMIPPYPDAPQKFNDGFKDLIKPKLLYFIESKELLGLDSLYQVKLREKANRK